MKFSYPSAAKPLQGYTIKRGIGVGGFGEVYFAISDAGKEVALKKIQRNLDVELRGVRQCLNLNHVNLISLWDIKTNGRGESWVVMEYVPGVSLRDIIEAFPEGMPETEIKKWFAATASGVAYLHKHGIVHRDLKPGNIFRDDDQHIVKIGDYGLSKFIACNRKAGQTEAVGTFHYMAPEIGNGVYGKEIDIYALGILLFEMLTGDVPFNGESSQEIIMKHLTANVPLENVTPAFHRVMLKSLNKDPQYRYASVQEMVKELPWRDLATNSEAITAQYAMGHPSLMNAAGCDNQPPVSYGKAKIAPIFITGDALEILKEDIVFGETAAVPPSNKSNETAPRVRGNPAIHKSTAPHRSRNCLKSSEEGSQTSSHQSDPTTVLNSTEMEAQAENDIATNVPVSERKTSAGRRRGKFESVVSADDHNNTLHPLIDWWRHGSTATLLKLIIVGIVIVLILHKPENLLQAAFIGGLFFLVAYFRRHSVLGNQTATSPATGIETGVPKRASYSLDGEEKKIISTFGIATKSLTEMRRELSKRGWRERLAELLGSMLIAALTCIVLNLIPFALPTSMMGNRPTAELKVVEPLVDFWGRYAFATTVSVCACWIILAIGKVWESQQSETWLRRGIMAFLGLVIGMIGLTAADFFNITMALPNEVPNTVSNATHSAVHNEAASEAFPSFKISGVPVIPAYLIFLIALFGALRWWYQVDPVRKSRLSIRTIGLCIVWAVVFSHVIGASTLGQAIFVIIVSTSLQLAAPWVALDERKIFLSATD